MKIYTAVVEKCPQTGLFGGYVPGFIGAHSQGETLDELYHDLQEVIEMLLEDGNRTSEPSLQERKWWRWLRVGSIPVLKPREVAAILHKLGFVLVRHRGSHQQFRHADGRGITVPDHQGRDISPALLRRITRDIDLTVEELLKNDED